MLHRFMEDFMVLASLQLPQLINHLWVDNSQIYDEYALLSFCLPVSYTLEDVMDMLEDQMELIILYHMIPSNSTSFGHRCCAYSNPAFGHMYKMNVMTGGNGLVNSVSVTIYDSLELMGGDLCNDLELHAKTGYFKYKREKPEVLSSFM